MIVAEKNRLFVYLFRNEHGTPVYVGYGATVNRAEVPPARLAEPRVGGVAGEEQARARVRRSVRIEGHRVSGRVGNHRRVVAAVQPCPGPRPPVPAGWCAGPPGGQAESRPAQRGRSRESDGWRAPGLSVGWRLPGGRPPEVQPCRPGRRHRGLEHPGGLGAEQLPGAVAGIAEFAASRVAGPVRPAGVPLCGCSRGDRSDGRASDLELRPNRWRVPLVKPVDLDACELRGRRVSDARFDQYDWQWHVWVDGRGEVRHPPPKD